MINKIKINLTYFTILLDSVQQTIATNKILYGLSRYQDKNNFVSFVCIIKKIKINLVSFRIRYQEQNN